MSPKLGRPTDNPKTYRLSVRLDEESNAILARYAAQENISQMEAARRGIKKLEADLKKK